mgnify:CR=1 FL=1
MRTKKGTWPERVVNRDTINDLARLKVKGSFKALPVISSRRLREGSKVFTFGHPNPSIQGLDPVYTSKAVAGGIDRIRREEIPAGSTLVYVHTGGNPALFAYAPELIAHGDDQESIVRE